MTVGKEGRGRIRVEKQTVWNGNGFGYRTIHTAYLDGKIVGEWTRDSIVPWAGEKRGIVLLRYSAWVKALEDMEKEVTR